jgi:hypothetical protein
MPWYWQRIILSNLIWNSVNLKVEIYLFSNYPLLASKSFNHSWNLAIKTENGLKTQHFIPTNCRILITLLVLGEILIKKTYLFKFFIMCIIINKKTLNITSYTLFGLILTWIKFGAIGAKWQKSLNFTFFICAKLNPR